MFSKSFFNRNNSILNSTLKYFSTTSVRLQNHKCKLLIVGGGSGGCPMSAKFAKDFKKGELIVVEPSDVHYYQPQFTFIGGGMGKLETCRRKMQDVLPKKVKWIKDEVVEFKPEKNTVTTSNGDIVTYDFMLVAIGMHVNYKEIPGLVEALSISDSGVCSNYSEDYVNLTFKAIQKLQSGNAIFTYPNTPVKCAGAPQKVCYITEDYLRKVGKRNKVNVMYNTPLPVLFGVKRYTDALWEVVKRRNININLRTNLIEVKPKEKVAIFQNLDKPEQKMDVEVDKYSMLHVTPPMGPPDVLKKCPELVSKAGYVDVNKGTLQHVQFPNVFAIGDCSSSPNSKTISAIAVQSKVLYKNMTAAMKGEKLIAKYNGYAACPLITGYNYGILAEFDYDLKPLETLPIRQDRELSMVYYMTRYLLPPVYWNIMLKGHWEGPENIRKLLHLKF